MEVGILSGCNIYKKNVCRREVWFAGASLRSLVFPSRLAYSKVSLSEPSYSVMCHRVVGYVCIVGLRNRSGYICLYVTLGVVRDRYVKVRLPVSYCRR